MKPSLFGWGPAVQEMVLSSGAGAGDGSFVNGDFVREEDLLAHAQERLSLSLSLVSADRPHNSRSI